MPLRPQILDVEGAIPRPQIQNWFRDFHTAGASPLDSGNGLSPLDTVEVPDSDKHQAAEPDRFL